MASCAIALCQNYRRKTKSQGITYHRFPSDPELRKLWTNRCKRADNFNIENARVCALHFTPDDYVRDLKAELLGSTPKRVLKANAVPTLHLPSSSCENNSSIKYICCASKTEPNLERTFSNRNESSKFMLKRDRASRCQARGTRKRALENLASLSPKKKKLQADKIDCATQFTSSDTSHLVERVQILEKENKRLNVLCSQLKMQKKIIFTELTASRRKLRSYQKMSRKVTSKQVHSAVKKIF
ncbi:THAP domain-containing protein 2-like [Stegodyphus dumicola]|uniref:THAP domain-containing protein 2-like n=1 Tax=Stegodyphus dumicola TaxID=202533 RepID=UPI0015A7D3B0|nr:THAP domain-containing protein 2-like [Stegodyphus dumicola]